MLLRRPALALSLVAALAACERGHEPRLWVAVRDDARIVAVAPSGLPLDWAAGPPALDAPVRALAPLRDGGVVVLQEPETCQGGLLDPVAGACVPAAAPRVAVPPVLLLSRGGERLVTFAAAGSGGRALFSAAAPPWAAAEDTRGRIWVTGRTAPVVYGRSGELALAPQALSFPTRGLAPLADGRVVVSYGIQDLAVYDADGAVTTIRTDATLGADHEGIDALAAEPGGALLVATRRFGVSSAAVVLRARIEGGDLVPLQEPARSAGLPGGIPSALVLAGGRIIAAPALGRLAIPACGRWLSADLGTGLGCVVGGPHRAAAWLP